MDLLVRRDSLETTHFDEAPPADLKDGEARLKVDLFAFTANNVTYAVFGDAMNYWSFFPAPEGWGRIPVWGFGDVVESKAAGLADGVRVYGYFPMSDTVVFQPVQVNERGFSDGAPHRAAMAAAYNHYGRVDADAGYDLEHEAAQALLRPLFTTAFLLDDYLADNDDFGAEAVILSSASSKTSAGTAFYVSQRGASKVVGLTSAGNVDFVRGLGVYDEVVTYDAVASLDTKPSVYIDVAGSPAARQAVHTHFGDALRHSAVVGGTHWQEAADPGAAPLPGPSPAFFFAPDQIRKRADDWGPAEYERRMSAAWKSGVEWSDGWLVVDQGRGGDAVADVYQAVLGGHTRPDVGHVLSL